MALASAIVQAVSRVENNINFDADVWIENDIHWWPVYRLEIYRRLFLSMENSNPIATRLRRVGPALSVARNLKNEVGCKKIWLVSDGISFATLGELQVEKFCDPLRIACDALGFSSVVIDRGSPKPRPTRHSMRWWAPWVQRAKIGGLLSAKLFPDQRHTDLVAIVNAASVAAGVELPDLSPSHFDAMARAIKKLARRLEVRMRRERVMAVFVVGYYDVSGYAFTLAASRAGVPSVDVQHGVTGRHHLAYSGWPQNGRGWALLPRWFWTWTEEDAAVIRDWANVKEPRHRAVCGGNPFMADWLAGRFTLYPSMAAKLDDLMKAAGNRRRVLVTLQPNLVNSEALGPLLWAMKNCDDVAWWLRLHPMALQERTGLETMLREHGVGCFDIETATAVPLPAILAHAGLHATHSSSSFIEAEELGVGSIVWSEYGAELAEEAVSRGAAKVALDGPAFRQHLLNFSDGTGVVRKQNIGLSSQAIRKILEVD